jgi:hypothetical protein
MAKIAAKGFLNRDNEIDFRIQRNFKTMFSNKEGKLFGDQIVISNLKLSSNWIKMS